MPEPRTVPRVHSSNRPHQCNGLSRWYPCPFASASQQRLHRRPIVVFWFNPSLLRWLLPDRNPPSVGSVYLVARVPLKVENKTSDSEPAPRNHLSFQNLGPIHTSRSAAIRQIASRQLGIANTELPHRRDGSAPRFTRQLLVSCAGVRSMASATATPICNFARSLVAAHTAARRHHIHRPKRRQHPRQSPQARRTPSAKTSSRHFGIDLRPISEFVKPAAFFAATRRLTF